MTTFDNKEFLNPNVCYRPNLMLHNWPKDRALMREALKAYGFGGVVTNPNQKKGFFADPENVDEFADILTELEEADMPFWIYDEQGYPSGYANGRVLEGHPELEAKGFYMCRRVAYEPRHTSFHLDEESDKIVWAAKYPIRVIDLHESFIEYENMQPVAFTETFCECDLSANEALFVFCVKPAYEGSHCTHNVCSFARYINVMDPRAVRRFLDVAYEPIAARIPDAYKRAVAVFTDEPSLQVGYARSYETWPYALAPWADGLFEEFEQEYGYSMLPYLPMLFEGDGRSYALRVQFYRLVGKMIAHAYSGQLSEWCRAHGGRFSGHYLGEETAAGHVKDYGSYLEVLKAADYPGVDVLNCCPDEFNCQTTKHAQMVVRKQGHNGMMAEISPFILREIFEKDPINNLCGLSGLMYLTGVRTIHSYFYPNFSAYDKELPKRGFTNAEETRVFTDYAARLGYMFDGLHNNCDTFVYYGVEDVQAKLVPQHSGLAGPETAYDKGVAGLTGSVFAAGHDFYYIDHEDLIAAGESLKYGRPTISGCEVKTVIVPSLDVMYDESVEALIRLQEAGVKVMFYDKVPRFGTKLTPGAAATASDHFTSVSHTDIMAYLRKQAQSRNFTAEAEDTRLMIGRFEKDGRELYFVQNHTRDKDADVVFRHKIKTAATVYDPTNGSVTPIKMGDSYTIPWFRGVFVWLD